MIRILSKRIKYKLDLKASRLLLHLPDFRRFLNELSYYFADQNYEAEYIHITGLWLSKLRQRLLDWKKQWNSMTKRRFPSCTLERKMDGMLSSITRTSEHRKLILRRL